MNDEVKRHNAIFKNAYYFVVSVIILVSLDKFDILMQSNQTK